VIKATGICKSYKNKLVLDKIDFEIAAGDAAVFVGRNGSGKSTLLSILSGFLRLDSGNVTRPPLVQFCPQENSLFDELTVMDNLKFWQTASGSQNNFAFTTMLGLDEYMQKKVKHLSGGMKKCLAICCTLTGNPDAIILDEPFAGLDILHKKKLLDVFKLLKAEGKTILYSSHSTDEICGLNADIYLVADAQIKRYIPEEKGLDMLDALLERL